MPPRRIRAPDGEFAVLPPRWGCEFDCGVVRQQHPAAAVDEIVERTLMSAAPVNPPELWREME